MVDMAKSFQKIRQMKGAENLNLTQAIENISLPFNHSALTAEEVSKKMKKQVLAEVMADLSLVIEARKTILRWRALCTRYFGLVNQVEQAALFASENNQSLAGGQSASRLDLERSERCDERDYTRDIMAREKKVIIAEIERF